MLVRKSNYINPTFIYFFKADNQKIAKMISDRMYKSAGKFIQFSALMGVIPYNWDCSKRRIVRCPHGRFYVRIHFFHISFGIILYLIMCLSSYLDQNLNDFNYSYCTTLTFLLISQIWILIIFWEDDIFNAINSFFFYVEHINRKFLFNFF